MPDEVMIAIAAAVATRAADALVSAGQSAVGRLVGAVRDRLGHDRDDTAALEAAAEHPSDEARVRTLGEALERVTRTDPAFAGYLRILWEQAGPELSAQDGGVVNQISGPVSGNVVQARDIHGDITFK